MDKCVNCNRKPTQKRKLDDNNVCNECIANANDEIPDSNLDDNKSVSEINFGDFKKWMKSELRVTIHCCRRNCIHC